MCGCEIKPLLILRLDVVAVWWQHLPLRLPHCALLLRDIFAAELRTAPLSGRAEYMEHSSVNMGRVHSGGVTRASCVGNSDVSDVASVDVQRRDVRCV